MDIDYIRTVELIHTTNCYVCFCIGMPLNVLLIYMILHKSPPMKEVYSAILLTTAIIDIYYLTICFLAEPVNVIAGSSRLAYNIGRLSGIGLSRTVHNLLYNMWFFGMSFSQDVLLLQYLYRYFLISRYLFFAPFSICVKG